MARTIQLPLDILHLILSHLHGDPESLRNCALTSSSILPPARASLFHHIVLENAGHIDRFSLLLTNSGHIAPFVRSLNIDDRSRSPNLNRPVSLHHPPFTRLRQLQRLVLSAVTLENCEELCLIIATLPTLRCLTCARIVGPPDSNTVGSSSLSPGTALAAAKPPPLTTLTIKQEDLSGPTAISLNPLAAWLSQNDPLSLIHSVELTLRTHDEHVAWLPVLRAVAHNLRSLRITTLEGPVSESANTTYTARMFDALADCPSLSSLAVSHLPDVYTRSADSADFLWALAVFLERSPPPLPALRDLALRMEHRDDCGLPAYQPACTRLARAIGGEQRYPCFARLDVEVKTMEWRAHGTGMSRWARRVIEASQVKEIPARWAALFAEFRGMPCAHVDVHLLHPYLPKTVCGRPGR